MYVQRLRFTIGWLHCFYTSDKAEHYGRDCCVVELESHFMVAGSRKKKQRPGTSRTLEEHTSNDSFPHRLSFRPHFAKFLLPLRK